MGLDEYHRRHPRGSPSTIPLYGKERAREGAPRERTAAMTPFSLPPDHRDCVPLEDVLQLANLLGPLSAQRVRDWVADRRGTYAAEGLPEWLQGRLDTAANAKQEEAEDQ